MGPRHDLDCDTDQSLKVVEVGQLPIAMTLKAADPDAAAESLV